MNAPNPGDLIAGRYRLDRELARGGMGSVWSAHDAKLKRPVAVKLVASDGRTGLDGEEADRRFEAEAMAVAKLQSPHVVQIFDYGREADTPFIVMELLDGEDLRARLHRHKRVSLETAALILVQTAKALSIAHAAGVVHRDLKPGNIFLVRAGEEEIVKVLDFGVAVQATDAGKLEGAPIMGTPQFMSPEQARGLPDLDHRADLWSLGVIVYKALTGRLPFNATAPTDVIVQVCTKDATPVSELAPDLPRELDAFFKRALARDPEKRFSSAREMALAFSRISPVNFTTLSMPDPKFIEAAIAAAKRGRPEDDEALTLVADPATVVRLEEDLEDLKTSVHIPPSLSSSPGLSSSGPESRELALSPGLTSSPGLKSRRALPPPKPPRRSRRGQAMPVDEDEPLTVVAPSNPGALAALADVDDDAPDSEEPPSTTKYPSVPTLAALEKRPPSPRRSSASTPLLVLGAMGAGLVVAVIGSLLSGRAGLAEVGLSQAPAALARDTLTGLPSDSPTQAPVAVADVADTTPKDAPPETRSDAQPSKAPSTTVTPATPHKPTLPPPVATPKPKASPVVAKVEPKPAEPPPATPAPPSPPPKAAPTDDDVFADRL